MPKPARFIISSDYASLGSDGVESMQLTVPSGASVAAGQERSFRTYKPLKTYDSVLYAEMSSSRFPGRWTPTTQMIISLRMRYSIDGQVYDFPTTASIIQEGRTLVLEVVISNPYGFALTVATTQDITANVTTLLTPFG